LKEEISPELKEEISPELKEEISPELKEEISPELKEEITPEKEAVNRSHGETPVTPVKSKTVHYMYLCPTCNNMNRFSAKFCKVCGDDLVKLRKLSLPRVSLDPVTGTNTLICTKCNGSNSLNATFCKSCGVNFIEMASICPKCYSVNRISAKFCKECGGTVRKVLGLSLHKQLRAVAIQTRECSICKNKNRITAKFCKKCGINLIEEKLDGQAKIQEISMKELAEELELIEELEVLSRDRLIENLEVPKDVLWPEADTQDLTEDSKLIEAQEGVKQLEKFLQEIDAKIKESIAIKVPIVKQEPGEKMAREYEEKRLRESLSRNKEFLSNLFSKYRNVKQDLRGLTLQIQNLKEIHEEARVELEECKKRFYSSQNSLKDYEQKFLYIRDEIRKYKEELDRARKSEIEIDRAHEDIKVLKDKYIESRSERRNLESIIRRAESEKIRIKKLVEKNRISPAEYNQKIEKFDRDILISNESLKKIETYISDYKSETDRLSNLIKSSKQFLIRDLEKQLAILYDEYSDVKMQSEYYTAILEKAKQDFNSRQSQSKQLNKELNSLTEEEKVKQSYLDDLGKQISSVKEKIEEIEEDLGRDTVQINLDEISPVRKKFNEDNEHERETREVSSQELKDYGL
jgi:ribosomal protein L40E